MHDDEMNELTAAERMMLAALPREMPVGDVLEERVVRALRREGHLGARGRRFNPLPVAWKVAAALDRSHTGKRRQLHCGERNTDGGRPDGDVALASFAKSTEDLP